MRSFLLLSVAGGLMLAFIGCGGSDSGDSTAVASSSGSAPPPPPKAGSPAAAPTAPAAGSSGAEGSQSSGPDGATGSSTGGYPGGSGPPGGYPGGSGPPGSGYPGGSAPPSGYPGGSAPPSGYPGGSAPPSGYPGGSAPPSGYPGGTTPPGSGYPGASSGEFPGASGYPGSPDGARGFPVAPPARPKSLREKAIEAFRTGRGDEGAQLLAAHYLTNPKAGAELARVMQFSPGLHKPTLVTRIGLAVVYSSQPASYDGHPQPIGSPELEAALASLERKTDGGGNREGGNPRPAGGIRRGARGGEGNPGAGIAPSGPGGDGGPGFGTGNNQLPTSPQEELAYFTGEVGTKLVDKIKAKLDAGDFGAIYHEALKDLPLAKVADGEGGQFGSGEGRGMRPPGAGGSSGPPIAGGGFGPPGGVGRPPGAEGGNDGKGGGVVTGQLLPGVEFLGAVENVKELGELLKTSSVDAVIYFEVRVRPATAIAFVNNDTTLRLVATSEPTKQLFASAKINNKQVHEARKKRGAEDPVAKEIDAAIAALETNFKLVPLPALTAEQATKRLHNLLVLKPEDATQLLLEGRLYVAKKLLKADDVVTLALTAITEEQLNSLSEVLKEGDIKEQVGAALTGKSADAPTTVLGKFGAALGGAGGLGNLVPTPQFPPGGLPGAMPLGGYPQSGPGPGGFPGSSGPPSGYPSGSPPVGFPQPGGLPASKGSSSESR